MDFFIASAYAQDGAQPGGLAQFLPLILIFVCSISCSFARR
ncbi:preprotein translocase subunit YajC [Marinihelvus fidelis]|nr:hypothetical protein [Marinihelvus fidelis]